MHLIEVIVSPSGETQIQTRGYAGSACLEASQFLEQALGTVTADQKTNEFYQPTVVPQQQQHGA